MEPARTEFTLKDSSGKIYTAYEIRGSIPTTHLRSAGRESLASGLAKWILADGGELTPTADPNVFVIVATGKRLTRE